MTAEKRIRLIRLQEKLNSNKKFAENAGIKWELRKKDTKKGCNEDEFTQCFKKCTAQ